MVFGAQRDSTGHQCSPPLPQQATVMSACCCTLAFCSCFSWAHLPLNEWAGTGCWMIQEHSGLLWTEHSGPRWWYREKHQPSTKGACFREEGYLGSHYYSTEETGLCLLVENSSKISCYPREVHLAISWQGFQIQSTLWDSSSPAFWQDPFLMPPTSGDPLEHHILMAQGVAIQREHGEVPSHPPHVSKHGLL